MDSTNCWKRWPRASALIVCGLLLRAPTLPAQQSYLDTLIALAGRPRAVKCVARIGFQGDLGQYNFFTDVVTVLHSICKSTKAPPLTIFPSPERRFSYEWILAHELGHRLDFAKALRPSFVWMWSYKKQRAATLGANGGWFLRPGPLERWAEAFANAVEFLRYAAGAPDTTNLHLALRARETFIPGTARAVEYLLEQPIFADHPLNRGTPQMGWALTFASPTVWVGDHVSTREGGAMSAAARAGQLVTITAGVLLLATFGVLLGWKVRRRRKGVQWLAVQRTACPEVCRHDAGPGVTHRFGSPL